MVDFLTQNYWIIVYKVFVCMISLSAKFKVEYFPLRFIFMNTLCQNKSYHYAPVLTKIDQECIQATLLVKSSLGQQI